MPPARPLKILMTADCVGGVWTYCMELARALRPEGVEIALAVMGAKLQPGQRAEAEFLPGVRLHSSEFKLEWMEDPRADVTAAGEWLMEIARDFQPDLIHSNGYTHAALPWEVPVIVVAHSCVCSWWQAVKGCPAPVHWDRYRDEARRGIQAADLVVAPSGAMLQETKRLFGPLASSRIIYNGCDPARCQQSRKEPFIFSAGRLWDEAKNIRALLAARSGMVWPVRIAGETQNPGGASSVWEMHSDCFIGSLSREQMSHWLARAAVFALPAKYEPFGLAPLEAALSGCALVLGDIPSLREIWGDAAVYADTSDPGAWAEALNELAASPRLLARKAVEARERAQRYSAQKMGAAYHRLYQELLLQPAFQPKEEEVLCG